MANFECFVHLDVLELSCVLTEVWFATTLGDFSFNSVWYWAVLYQIVFMVLFWILARKKKKYLVHGLKVVQSHVLLIRGLAGTIDVDKGWIAMAPIRCQLLSLMMIQVLRPCSCILMGLGGHHVLWIFESRDSTLFTMGTLCVITLN